MERAGVSMFNEGEEMADAAGLHAHHRILRKCSKSERLPTVIFGGVKYARA